MHIVYFHVSFNIAMQKGPLQSRVVLDVGSLTGIR